MYCIPNIYIYIIVCGLTVSINLSEESNRVDAILVK